MNSHTGLKQEIRPFDEEAEPPGMLPLVNASALLKEIPPAIQTPGIKVVLPQRRTFFPISRRSDAFRRRFFPDATVDQWNDWHWQLRHRITDLKTLGSILRLSVENITGTAAEKSNLPLSITPYFASLLDEYDVNQPLRKTVVPLANEHIMSPGEESDPLDEENDSPVPGLVHRYPDRVLFLVTNFCSTYCRYCTRSRMVGKPKEHCVSLDRWEKAIDYIAKTKTVRDVLLSGGDPLTLSDERIEWLLSRLRKIPHVEIVRIGTKVPVVLPMRITKELVRMLKKYHPLWMNIHFSHPDELTAETKYACERLADAGIPLGSQTVLLKDVNDSVDVIKNLMHGLLQMRVRPYYLYQCDPIPGSAHFRTPVKKGIEIIEGLRGHTTGLAVPNFVIDAPGGGGKIPLIPEYVKGYEGSDLVLRNYAQKYYRYPDVLGE
ncbi:MAG TPA: KamA family radical SAM protein [Spirochaetia bacterium]|nr:KamA family radical SAM protein [Spirochaetia bacterium]